MSTGASQRAGLGILPSAAGWARLLPGLALLAALLLLFRETTVAMVTIWLRSDTFAHAILVPPIVLWLVWRRRDRLALLPVQPVHWLLVPLLVVCLFWLLGEVASTNVVTQYALVALIVVAVPALYGWAITRELAFPLMFLFFAVPAGDILVPLMMEYTADFTVWALQMSRIPVYREGLQFVIPSGNWSVVEACSGVRYLIASFMVGTLFAYLNYSSLRRRVLFMLVSLAVPIVANWFRAYLIVMLGHLSGNKLAAGVDHIIYGWVFFGIVIGVMFLIGARWAQPEAATPPDTAAFAQRRAAGASPLSLWLAAAAVAVVGAAAQMALGYLNRPSGAPELALQLPAPTAPWTSDSEPLSEWVPAFQGTTSVAKGSFKAPPSAQTQVDTRVAVWLGYYATQNYERKLITSTNGLTSGDLESGWAQLSRGSASLQSQGQSLVVRTGVVRGSAHLNGQAQRLRVWQLYWVGGRLTSSDAQAKIYHALQRLLGRGEAAAVVLMYTPVQADSDLANADAVLGRFAADHLAKWTAALQAASAQTP
jgi:exosortase A